MIVIYLFIIIICVYVVFQKYYQRQYYPEVKEIKRRLSLINSDYANIPIYIDDSAYTINKQTIYICLKDKKTGKLYDMNTLMYVTIHELAHVMTREKEYDAKGKINDHGPKFIKNFEHLINVASQRGVYDKNKQLPSSYCGTERN